MSAPSTPATGRRFAQFRTIAHRGRRAWREFRWVTGIKLENAAQSISRRRELIIFDDAFPHLLTSFRIAEFNRYFEEFGSSLVHSTGNSFPSLGDHRPFEAIVEEYESAYPRFKDRVRRFDPRRKLHADVLYSVFLQNAHVLLEIARRDNVPFVFTLYPGGGFRLNAPESDEKLRAVCSSPQMKKVIATQKVTRDYLVDGGFCRPEQVEFIYGGVFPADRLGTDHTPRKLYGRTKRTFDICFVAHKYMAGGIDKGYDVFVHVAQRLADRDDIRFHVVGPFGPHDGEVTLLGDRIHFWGSQTTGFFSEFYGKMDIILAPNVPFVLYPGAFDGFPTGACIEAGLAGVGVFAADPLKLNIAFKDGQEIVIVPHDADATADIIRSYYRNYDRLCELAWRGRDAFRRVFSLDQQMGPRLKLLSDVAANGRGHTA